MKKLTLCIMTALLLLAFVPMQLNAEPETYTSPKATTEVMMTLEETALMDRLEEINAMDKSDLSSSDRKELRKEVRDIKKELKERSGGVYISVGAAILIVLLLILIL
jgi:Ribonuclease G/E